MADTRLSDERLAEIRAREPIEIATNHHITIGGYLGTQEATQVYAMLADRAVLLAEVERLRAALEQEQREHGNCEDFHFRTSQAQTQVMVALAEQNAAMRPIVEDVVDGCTMAMTPNGKEKWCATCLCIDETGGDDWSTSPHDSHCTVTRARAVITKYPAGEAS